MKDFPGHGYGWPAKRYLIWIYLVLSRKNSSNKRLIFRIILPDACLPKVLASTPACHSILGILKLRSTRAVNDTTLCVKAALAFLPVGTDWDVPSFIMSMTGKWMEMALFSTILMDRILAASWSLVAQRTRFGDSSNRHGLMTSNWVVRISNPHGPHESVERWIWESHAM